MQLAMIVEGLAYMDQTIFDIHGVVNSWLRTKFSRKKKLVLKIGVSFYKNGIDYATK